MTRKLLVLAVIVTTTSLFIQSSEAQARGHRQCKQRNRSYTQTTKYYSYPAESITLHDNVEYGVQEFASYAAPPTRYENFSGYGYPNQFGYSSRFGNQIGYSSYGYPTRGRLSIGFGTRRFGNRGYRGFGY